MPIHAAIEIGNIEIIKAFIESKAEMHHLDDNDRTPLMLAKQLKRSSEIIDLLSTATELLPPQTIPTPDNRSNQPSGDDEMELIDLRYTQLRYAQPQDPQYCSIQ